MESTVDDPPIVWTPNENSGYEMKRFMKRIEQKYSLKFNGYWDLHKWSVDNVIEFWSEMWNYTGVICSKKYDKVLDLSVPLEKCPKWFEGARLNYTENILRHRETRTAFIFSGEESETEKLTFNQLFDEVSLYSAALRKTGFKKGDVAASYISNKKEAIFTMFAVVSIGGIWTGALPQLGSKAVLNRFSQIEPKLLLTTDRFSYNREEFQLLQNIEEIVNGLPSLEKVLIVPSNKSSKSMDIQKIRNSCFLDDFLENGKEADGSVPPIMFEQVSVSHPIFINFTSGTTGLPKPVMHGSGILLSIVKDYFIHCDSPPGSVWLGTSPVGWVTWNIFVSLPTFGSTVLIYDGFPFFMSPTFLWDMVEEHKISHIFIATSIIEELIKRNYMPTDKHTLKSLNVIFAGGSIVKPYTYDCMYQAFKGDVLFSSGFGSTETIGSCFLSDFTLPLYRGEISAITLGYNYECLNEEGKHVLGEIGELAIVSPVPNLPLGLFNDKDGIKYREKYFNKYSGKFLIGDNGKMNPKTKGITICGRSDETLKQRGCRFGSSEIYNIVEQFSEIHDSLCVSHYNQQMDERAVLFLKMKKDHHFTEGLVGRIRQAITKELTVRHVPDIIIETRDIPYNVNGKKMELLVKKIINNKPYITDFVSNPDSLKHFINRKELCTILK